MLNHVLLPDTQAILLLCASFGQNRLAQPQPLTLSEYNVLAGWLKENQIRPAVLLDSTGKNQLQKIPAGLLDIHRVQALLERGVMLSLAVEKWTNQGLWVLARSDSQYPQRLKQTLRHLAPAILYGVGNVELLSQGGLAVVGSRDVDEEGLDYTQRIAQTCAQQEMQVVSGGARGVDSSAMLAAIDAGGTAVGVLADSLTKAAVAGKYRPGIKEGRLTLLSAYDPDSGFNVGNAMGRNKYIYALADYALVVSSSYQKGGTWAGAVEALQRIKDVPVFVRLQGAVPEGNRQLVNKGAKPFPEAPWNNSLRELLQAATSNVVPTITSVEGRDSQVADVVTNQPSPNGIENNPPQVFQFSRKDIYEAVLPFILSRLENPLDEKSLAESLDVQLGQMRAWLKRAVEEGKVRKTKKPVAYVINSAGDLLSLLDEV